MLARGGPALWLIAALSVLTLALVLWKVWRLALAGAWARGLAEALVPAVRARRRRQAPADSAMGQRRAQRHRARQGLPEPPVSDTARIRLTLTGDGQLTPLGVASSSGDAALDRAGAGPHSYPVPLSPRP